MAALTPLACSPGSDSSVSPPRQTRSAQSSLIVESTPISLGILRPGETTAASVIVRNPLDVPSGPVRLRTDCPCVQVRPEFIDLGPLGSASITITFDPSHDPGFRGRLAVPLVGEQSDSMSALRSTVIVSVQEVGQVIDEDMAGAK